MPSLTLRQNVEWIERRTIQRALAMSSIKRHAARLLASPHVHCLTTWRNTASIDVSRNALLHA